MTPDEVAKLEQAVTQASREIRRLEKLIAERDAALTAAQHENARLTAEREVGTCAVCQKPVMAGQRVIENRDDSPTWHSWCYGRMQKQRAERAEADAARLREALEKANRAAPGNRGSYPLGYKDDGF